MDLIIKFVFAAIVIAPCLSMAIAFVLQNVSEHSSTSNL